MNVHSHGDPTIVAQPSNPGQASDSDRRDLIIAAAERAFVRHGFHAATMQQVAEEAGMSAGNLYRYFPSKEALVEGLCSCDQHERSAVFASLIGNGSIFAKLATMLREQVLAKPREKARMFIEITAEAGRNPRIAAMSLAVSADARRGLAALLDAAKAKGEAAASMDSAFAAHVLVTLADGLFKRRALEPDFDADAEAAMALGVLRALFAGTLTPFPDQAEPR
jgi:AcrR family transcriptional regulator